MKHYAFKLTALSPLALRADYAPGGAETAKFITGTTLIGSLAAAHRLLHNDQEKEFATLFLQGGVQYPHLYPALFKSKELRESDSPVYPIPKTAQSCKRFKGFRKIEDEENSGSEDEGHGVRDSLLDWAMFKIGSDSGKGDTESLQALEAFKYCPSCAKEQDGISKPSGVPLDHLEGYYRWSENNPPRRGVAIAETRLQTHTGINRDSHIVQEGILYNREVFEEGTCFWGMVRVADTVDGDFRKFMKLLYEQNGVIVKDKRVVQGLVRIGTGRTRGLGKVDFELYPPLDEQEDQEDQEERDRQREQEEQERFSAFKQRLDLFNAALQARATDYQYQKLAPYYFALTLHAPVILRDELLRYRGTIEGDTLAQLIGLTERPFKLIHQAASIRRVAGWQELWGTPRANEYAIDNGSVFLFSSAIGPEDAWLRPLFELEEQGLGQRCTEGFGRIAISDPFHREGDFQ